jgi:hypothetical protein
MVATVSPCAQLTQDDADQHARASDDGLPGAGGGIADDTLLKCHWSFPKTTAPF